MRVCVCVCVCVCVLLLFSIIKKVDWCDNSNNSRYIFIHL